jgi:hypothetical protein
VYAPLDAYRLATAGKTAKTAMSFERGITVGAAAEGIPWLQRR